jgi:hypothetical protein
VPIDFTKLAPVKRAPRFTDPIALFQSLRVTDAAINDLWLAQGDALREWNEHRTLHDIAIVLNTGAGKTLVGLLIAQSLVNETQGHVLYACSSIQLIEQTALKAKGYGVDVTTYFQGNFSNTLYHQGQAPCITTYQALFNGLSRFPNDQPTAVIFDDAHTAGHLLRDQFTLTIAHDKYPSQFSSLVDLFRAYFARIRQEMGYLETRDRADGRTSRFVPPFAVREQFGEIQRLLLEAQLGNNVSTKFAWAHLQDHLDLCATFVSGTEVSITPPVIPVHSLDYFQADIRRIYLSATLTAADSFVRSFGRAPDRVIAPTTTAGECERLILLPALAQFQQGSIPDTAVAKTVLEGRKGLVIVPSGYRRSEHWEEMTTVSGDNVTAQVEEFKVAPPPACLVLTARYDGIDLPGDTCRILVIDDLPTGLNPLERYLWERLNLEQLLRSTVASRTVQSFGRISRGMSDHGVVVLTGRRLMEWILSPRNQALLPDFLRQQLQLGQVISEQLTRLKDVTDVTNQCLERNSDWIKYYQDNMEVGIPDEPEPADAHDILTISQREVEFGKRLWEREYERAAHSLARELNDTFRVNRATGAWHTLWIGYCHELLGDVDQAHDLYRSAHRATHHIPAFEVSAVTENEGSFPPQVIAVASALQRGTQIQMGLPPRFDVDLTTLDGAGPFTATEAALEALGDYLGLEASRPDNDHGSGPDILWTTSGGPALSMEAKTDKGPQAVYTKEDLGQLRDHRQWVTNHHGDIEIYSAFVGPHIRASTGTNPDSEMVVIELAQFAQLRERLKAALTDICDAAMPVSAAAKTLEVFTARGLLWPEVFQGLPKQALVNS